MALTLSRFRTKTPISRRALAPVSYGFEETAASACRLRNESECHLANAHAVNPNSMEKAG